MGRTVAVALALAAAVVAVYWPVAGHEFVALDDPPFITSNPAVQAGLSWQGLQWAFDNDHWSWHPLTWLSHQLDCDLFGLDPAGHHLENVLLHLVNTLLLFGVFRSLTGCFWRSAALAALFALHPLCVETVAWAAERKGLLSTFFGLSAIGAYARYARRPAPGRYVLVAVLFTLCLLSKAMLVTLPFLLLLLDLWPLRRVAGLAPIDVGLRVKGRRRIAGEAPKAETMSLGRLILEKVPLLLLAVGPAILATRADPEPIALASRLANAVVSYSRYLEKTIWPFGLALPYPYPEAWSTWRILTAVALVVVLTVLATLSVRRRPYVTVGWFWYLGALVPVIGIVQSGVQSMADRFSYVPMIGLLVAAVWTVADRTRSRRALRILAVTALFLVLGGWTVRSSDQLRHWSSTTDLFTHAARVTRDNFRAHAILGAAFLRDGALRQARTHLVEAARIRPDEPEVQLGLGNLMLVERDYAGALAHLSRAVELGPAEPRARGAGAGAVQPG